MITLFIDTRNNQKVSARLDVNGKIFKSGDESKNRRPESIVALIDKVCFLADIKIHDIDKIAVEEGPGSYTGLKVGASVANALSFTLGKKVNGKDFGTIIKPKYE